MRHKVKGKKLGRDTKQRKALRIGLALALLQHGRIRTTRAKAEFVRGFTERLITIAKRGIRRVEDTGDAAKGVHARRIAASRLGNRRDAVQKLFDDIAPRFATRNGGYTRMLKLGPRRGDSAEMVFLELVDYDYEAAAQS